MNLSQKQTKYLGIALIALGLFAVLRLWWLLPVLALAGGGAYLYMQRRAVGRVGEAVQLGLWGVGLAFLYMIGFVLPGVLLLGGASLLLRGHATQVDDRIQLLLSQVRNRRGASTTSYPSSNVPAQPTQPTKITIVNDEQPSTGETVRLK